MTPAYPHLPPPLRRGWRPLERVIADSSVTVTAVVDKCLPTVTSFWDFFIEIFDSGRIRYNFFLNCFLFYKRTYFQNVLSKEELKLCDTIRYSLATKALVSIFCLL